MAENKAVDINQTEFEQKIHVKAAFMSKITGRNNSNIRKLEKKYNIDVKWDSYVGTEIPVFKISITISNENALS